MSTRALRCTLFVSLFVLAPLPMVGIDLAVFPAARYCLLAGVCIAVGLTEGAAGPVGMITALFTANALVYTAVLWGVSWLAARGLARLPRIPTRNALLVVIAIAALSALLFDVYITPYGVAARANLVGALS